MDIKKLSFEEKWDIISKLPEWIQDNIADKDSAGINIKIYTDFKLSNEQIDALFNILILIYSRKLSLINLPEILMSELKLDKKTSDNLALKLAQEHFWTMQDYIGGVEKLIKSLNGKIPKNRPRQITEQKKIYAKNIDADKNSSTLKTSAKPDNIIAQKNIKAILEETKEIENQLITSQNITLTSSGEIKKPSIKYWLSEYIQTLGAGYHSNLDRIGFLYNNQNAKRLPDEERLVLGTILKSYDDGDSLPFSETTGRLLVEKLKQ